MGIRERKDSPRGTAGAQSVRKDATGVAGQVCREIEPPLRKYVQRITNGSDDAEDIIQEALLRLVQAIQDGGQQRSPRAYAFRIAHNLAVDAWREHARVVDAIQDAVPPASRETEVELLREQIERALAGLPENHRSALYLRELGELSYDEIADTMGVNVAQVKIWIYRARQKMKTLLDRDGQYIGGRNDGKGKQGSGNTGKTAEYGLQGFSSDGMSPAEQLSECVVATQRRNRGDGRK